MSLDPKNVQKFFAQAIEISDPQQRHAFLAERCAGDAELFRRVSELLTAFDQPKQYLNQPTVFRDNGLDADRKGQQPGSIIAGRYKLLEAIAEGGMGTVWVAEQIKPVRRKVAIKLIKPGMDSRQVLARFDAERQALALMDHPNIAKVFDGGVTDQGRPFFAMEYVKGMPLTEYCDQMRLSLAERLKLFIPICQAVQHAHQKGIIHRDLKPSNVLICLYDGKPVPKVIDFGLAKAMYQPLTEQTLHTGHGLMLGTPLYMSPEQAEHNNLDVDTRTDVYSLGVMLYELLTGTTPLEKAQMKDAAFGEILRLIKEVEPPKPSTRVSTNAQRASIAAQRSLDPEQLGRSIRGDLDWIIMKALDKERDRRYETANGLARDIERFLSHEAVEACPPSTIYRLQKQFQKHRTSISTAAAFLLLLCAGAVISMWQAVRATNAEQVAVKARDEAIVNEGLANVAKTAESTARVAEEQARAAESEQRGVALTQKAEAETQRTEAEKQRDEAQRLQQEAIARSAQLEKLTEEQRRAIYASDMNLVRLESLRGNLPRMREILYAQLPIDRADLRGFEWNYWYRYLTQAKVLRHFDNFRGVGDDASLPVIFRPVNYTSHPVILRGAKIAAVPKGPSTTLVKLESGEVLQTIPNAIGALMARARFAANGRSVFGGYSSQSAFSPPPQLAETGTSPLQGSLRPEGFVVYDPNAEPRTWTYPADTFSHISFLNISEDGRFVGALGNDVTHVHGQPACRILIWNIDTQKLVLDHLENRLLNRFVFNEDGSRIAAFYCHGPMTLSNELRDVVVALDVAEGKVLGVARHNDDIDTANWLPDGRRLVLTTLSRSGNQQKEILSWELESQQPRRLSGELMPNNVITATSPDGRLVAVSSHSTSSIRLIDTTTGSVVRTLHNEASNIESMDFSLDGTRLMAFCASGDVVQWAVIQDDDRFALRSRPLPTSTTESFVSWKFSEKQDRLAFGNRSTFLSVRDADGRELFHRETDEPRTPSSAAPKLHFDQEGNLLAVMDAKPGSGNIELIDLKESKVRWNVQLGNSPDSTMQMEFTNDHSSLIVSYFSSTYRIDVQTGEFKEIPVSSEQGSLSVFQLRRSENSEKLFAVGYATTSKSVALEIRDAVTGETLRSVPLDPSRDMRQRRGEDRAIASPNGESIAHSKNGFIELWDMTTQQMLFNTNGIDCVFSTDGRSLVVTTSSRNSAYKQIGVGNTGTAGAVDGARIVSATNGRIITEFSFAGDPADEVRLSSDGSRLLSLHGKRPSADISQPAQARLWDCASGREILDLPIAPECEFFWDLQLSPTGDSLTGVILSRHRGNATGGRSFVFDATPLSPEADAQLVAANWFRKLKQTTPVRQQMVDTIDANRTSVPLVRQITLELASHVPFDADKVASQCMGVIEGTDHEMVMVERALSWARTLEKSEPGSLRAISLISAAQYRLGQAESALQTLQQADKNFTAGDTSNLKWEHLRRAVEVLCLHRLSKDPIIAHRKAIELVDFMQDAYMTNTTYAIEESISWSRTMREVLLIQGEAFFFQQARPRYRPALVAAQAAQLTDDRAFNVKNAEVVFRLADANGDQVISNIEFPSQKEWETFGSFKMEREFGVSGMGLRNFHLPGLLKEWERFARFDRDGIAGLSLSEWTAGNLLLAATAEATPPPRCRFHSINEGAVINEGHE